MRLTSEDELDSGGRSIARRRRAQPGRRARREVASHDCALVDRRGERVPATRRSADQISLGDRPERVRYAEVEVVAAGRQPDDNRAGTTDAARQGAET